jgi:arylsulfatase A-like enzyme
VTRGALAAAALVALLVPSCGPGAREIAQPPERIVLIVIDTLRRDHLSAYGSRTSTPHIDELASEGQLFTNAFSSFHQTTMSMASLFTGRAPSLDRGAARERLELTGRTWCGMLRFAEEGGEDDCIPESLSTLAGQLGNAGYWTVGIVSNLLLYRPGGYQRGFDRWVELSAKAPTAAEVNLELRRVLGERPRDRLFLYIHYMDVHDYGRRGQSYASAVEFADRGIGQLMDILGREDLLDGALIILTSDHGERLGEGHFAEGLPGHNGNPSFDTLLKIPLIVSPAVFAHPDAVVRSDDLHRMILEVAGAGPGPEPDLEQEELFLTELRYQTYRKGRWKSYRDRGTGQLQLVDLEKDPGETRDVSSRYPEIVAFHARRIDELAVLLGAGDAPPMELSEEDRERLRALGYVRAIRLK